MNAAPRPPLAQLLAKATAFVVILVVLGFTVAIGVVTVSPSLRGSLAQLMDYYPRNAIHFEPSVPIMLGSGIVVIAIALALKWAKLAPRRLGLVALGSLVVGLGALYLYAYWPAAAYEVDRLGSMARDSMPDTIVDAKETALGAGIVALLTVLTLAALGLPLVTWRRLGIVAGALIAILLLLAIDERRSARPLTLEQGAPVAPGDEQSYALLMTYGNEHPLGKNFKNPAPNRIWTKGVFQPGGDRAEWIAWLQANRADLQSDWIALAPVRTWCSQLNAFETIGDLTPPNSREILSYSVARILAQHASAIAGLQALDRHGDQAIDTLLPVIELARKLQAKSRTPVRTMLARVVEHLEMQSVAFILSQTSVSARKREELRSALLIGVDPPAEARRYYEQFSAQWQEFGGQLALGSLVYNDEPSNLWRLPLNLISPFIYNSARTTNVICGFDERAADYAAKRQITEIVRLEKEIVDHESSRLKNIAGAAFLQSRLQPGGLTQGMAIYADSFWKIEDQRVALLKQIDSKT